MNRGSTMMEVCVAIPVLTIGAMGLLHYFDAFNHIRDREREAVETVVDEIDSVEYFIQNPPACSGNLPHLVWVETAHFRRLVECR